MEGMLKHRLMGPASRSFDSIGPGWELRICISHKFSGDAAELALGESLSGLE